MVKDRRKPPSAPRPDGPQPGCGPASRRFNRREAAAVVCSAAVGGALWWREVFAAGTPRGPRRHLRRATTRLTCLYNGYLLTVDPAKALAASSSADRYRLFVLHGLLIHPDTGRIAAIFPALGQPAFAGGPVARPASAYAQLASQETPSPPGITASELVAYWRRAGVSEALLDAADWVDLNGAVVTPGLTDTHFHVTSWSKKLPAPGERFGYYADLSDPAFYINTADWSHLCARDALWRIVAEANRHLLETGDDRIFLHGYQYNEIDSDAEGHLQAAYLFEPSASCEGASPNPVYLLNRVGAKAVTPPPDPCSSDPAGWPPMDYPMLPALLVQTSGQTCWYNVALLQAYNQMQHDISERLQPLPLSSVTSAGSASGDMWILAVPPDTPEADVLFTASMPYPADVVVTPSDGSAALTVPFDIVAGNSQARTLTAQAMIPELATSAFAAAPASLKIQPFWRPIVECIPQAKWEAAAAYWGQLAASDPVGYGCWDPRDPYATNWYNGAKRGLIQYFKDTQAQAWRPTGFAEHYPMRDALGAVVMKPFAITDLMEQRRRAAAWCHRHGLTMVNDIMFYRRDGEGKEFDSYEALSFDHSLAQDTEFFSRVGLDPATATGNLNLRVGVYYYVEAEEDIDETLRLAHSAENGSDLDRLQPPTGHPEFPGWVRWLGWKLQLDGASFTRNAFTNAPLPKSRLTDPLRVANELGNQVTFADHSYGLLTMTDLQEQVLTSRETAALYWLVRESDPGSAFRNPQIPRNWSVLARGVVNFLGASVDRQLLAADLEKLSRVTLDAAQAAQLADKLAAVVEQVNDAWERTMAAIIRIWYERSRTPAGLRDMPAQVVCHTSGDGAVDLWARAIKQLKTDVESLPTRWVDLPARWQAVLPENADLAAIRRIFQHERFRSEHLLYISRYVLEDASGVGSINAATAPDSRNYLVTLQPSIVILHGGTGESYPAAQELWPIPSTQDTWLGAPPVPRTNHTDALRSFIARDIPMTLNTDPPAMRDPRPALTVLGAVTRTPVEIDPTHWADQTGAEPAVRPPDYLAGKVYAPFGLKDGTNPMQLTIEEALAAMTFWGAYSANMEAEVGTFTAPAGTADAGRFADLVVWRSNPLGIKGPNGLTLEALATMPAGADDAARLATVNAFIQKFLPRMTVVGGVPVYHAP